MRQAATQQPTMTLTPFWSGEGNLSYLIANPATQEALLIDPDLAILGRYLLRLDREALTLKAVIDTHTHAEHATASPSLVTLTGCQFLMNHRAPSSFVTQGTQDNETLEIAGLTVRFIYSPGHTPDLQAIQIGNHLFTGDSLFNRSCGRADFPGSDAGQQYDSLMRLMQLPDETMVYPGHDYNQELESTIGEIRQNNPRVQFESRQAFVDFMAEQYRTEEKPDDFEYYIAFNQR